MNEQSQASAEVQPPPAFEAPLRRLADWLADLEDSRRCHHAPTPEDSEQLNQLLGDVYRAINLPKGTGIPRGSEIQRRFQEVVGHFFQQSPCIYRCFSKPRGYAGDYLMMLSIYRNGPSGETPFGRWMDAWVLDQPGFEAVRNRRDKLMFLLIEEWSRGARFVMNVASGAAQEIAEVAHALPFEELTLLDQDQGALAAAAANLGGRAGLTKVQTWCSSVLSLVRPHTELPPASKDFIYSIGLYDYLSSRLARALTAQLWKAVAPGGLLVLGNFNGHHPMRLFIELAMDWYLIYRDPPDLLELTASLPGVESADVWTDRSGCLHLLVARKAGALLRL